MTIKQKEFLKEFKDLLLKYNVEIDWTCDECSDTHGLYNDHLYISMLGQEDIDLYSNSIDYNDLDELYNKATIEIDKKLGNKKMEKRWNKDYENRRFKN